MAIFDVTGHVAMKRAKCARLPTDMGNRFSKCSPILCGHNEPVKSAWWNEADRVVQWILSKSTEVWNSYCG